MLSLEAIVLITLALGAGAIVKGATGLGLPLVALPVLASFFDVRHAILIMVVPIIVTNIWQIWELRGRREGTGFLIPMLSTGVVGIGLGTWLLAGVPAALLSLGLGVVLLAYIGLRIARPAFALSPRVGMRFAAPVGLAAGFMQGATGLSTPITIPFIHAHHLGREPLVFALSIMFLTFAIVQLIAMWTAQLVDVSHLLEGVVALVPVLVFMPVGNWIGRIMSQRVFNIAVLCLLAAVAANLILASISHL